MSRKHAGLADNEEHHGGAGEHLGGLEVVWTGTWEAEGEEGGMDRSEGTVV